MVEIVLDEPDFELLEACEEKSGSPLADILGSLPGQRSQRTFYRRFNRLEKAKLIRIDRKAFRGRALCFIEEAGKRALAGRHSRPDQEEV